SSLALKPYYGPEPIEDSECRELVGPLLTLATFALGGPIVAPHQILIPLVAYGSGSVLGDSAGRERMKAILLQVAKNPMRTFPIGSTARPGIAVPSKFAIYKFWFPRPLWKRRQIAAAFLASVGQSHGYGQRLDSQDIEVLDSRDERLRFLASWLPKSMEQ